MIGVPASLVSASHFVMKDFFLVAGEALGMSSVAMPRHGAGPPPAELAAGSQRFHPNSKSNYLAQFNCFKAR